MRTHLIFMQRYLAAIQGLVQTLRTKQGQVKHSYLHEQVISTILLKLLCRMLIGLLCYHVTCSDGR